MTKLVLIALVAVTAGCNRKQEEEALEPPPPVTAPATPPATAVPPVAPVGSDALVANFEHCWELWSQAKWDELNGCYAPDATFESPGTGEPAAKGVDAIIARAKQQKADFPDLTAQHQLILVNGHNIAAITLLSGTHSASHQRVGFLLGTLRVVDDAGRVTKEAAYFDAATLQGQLQPDKAHPVRAAQDKLAAPTQTVVAKTDAAEQANVALVKQLIDALNKHDKAFGALLADDVVWSEQHQPKDFAKADVIADRQAAWAAMPDLKLTPSNVWAAGAYVVAEGVLDGTRDGATHTHVSVPWLAIANVDGGKIARAWLFMQSAAR